MNAEITVAKYLLCDRETAKKKEIAAFVAEEKPKWAGKVSAVIEKYKLESVDCVK